MSRTVGLVRLSLTRGLISAASAAIAVVWGYAVFVVNHSAFLTGLLNTAYTLAFAAASSWLTMRYHGQSGRNTIVATGLIRAATVAAIALLAPLNAFGSLLSLVLVVGAATGATFPAWYSEFRRGRDGTPLHAEIGTYESFRVLAVLGGTVGGGLVAHLLGLQTTMLVIAAMYAAGGLLALTFSNAETTEPNRTAPAEPASTPPGHRDRQVNHRVQLLFGLLAVLQLMLSPITAVTPVLAVEGVDGSVADVGLLIGLYGAGSVMQFITTKAAARGVGVRVLVSAPLALMLGCASLATAWDTVVSAGILMVAFGFGVASISTLINAEIQASVHESKRDKRVSTYALVFSLPQAIGSGVWGLVADFLAVPTIAIIATASTALIAFLLLVSWRQVSGSWGR